MNLKKRLKKASALLLMFLMIFSLLSLSITSQVGAVPEPGQNMCEVDLDVVMVVDRSGSMSGNPLAKARIAAKNFVGFLGQNDRSALVSYSTDVKLDNGLTNDHEVTKANIQNLDAGGLTNTGGAIELANAQFSSGSQAMKVEILLTDGRANMGPSPIDKANEAAALGIKIFTIGLGSGVNETILQNIASITGAQYYYAPTPTDLEGIYNSIRWQLCQYGSISGCKYSTDPSGNNQSIMTGWNLTLEGNGYLQTQVTDQYGCYTFAGLSRGAYVLSEGNNPGIFEQTYPVADNGTYIIDLQEGNHFTYDFGNYFPSCDNSICDANYGEDCCSCPQDCGQCEPDTVTVVATKIVCDNEESLPNWGAGGPNITATTATEFVAQNPGCHLTEGWSFQVGDQTAVKYAGDFYGEAPSQDGWTTFGPTDSNGVTQTTVVLTPNTTQLRLREVLQNGYIPFTYPPNDNPVSAEFYCHTDVYKYDNYDWIFESELVAGATYYCVAFNALEAVPVYECNDGIDNDADTLIDANDPGCWTDPQNPQTYDPTDNDETNDSLPQCSDYLDNDQDGDIDEEDATCSRNGVYDPTIDDEENQRPVITVNPVSITITVGDSFNSADYATATDPEDGDITGDIVVSGDTVDTNTPGTYYVVYDVNDSEGLDAVTKTLEVIVEEVPIPDPYCGDGVCNGEECCSSCPQDCGQCEQPTPTPPIPPSSGGGGGIIPLSFNNYQECVVDGNTATFTWMTNKPSSSQVVCDPDGHNPSWTSGPDWGYSIFTEEYNTSPRVLNHSVEVELLAGETYYCRIMSSDGGIRPVKEDLTCVVPAVAGASTEEIPPVTECRCPQLLETYIKLGAQNNPNDVRGLEWALNGMGYPVAMDNVYGINDFIAVSQLQKDNNIAILSPWFLGDSTGYVYYTTQKFVNEWYCKYRGCPKEFPLTAKQQKEINWYKNQW